MLPLLLALAQASSPAADGDPAALVRELGSEDLDVRDRAEERLLLLGAGALDALGRVPEDAPPELVERARGLHLELRRRLGLLDRLRRKDPDVLKDMDDLKPWASRQLERSAVAAADAAARTTEVDALARLRGIPPAQAWAEAVLAEKRISLDLPEGSRLPDAAREVEKQTGLKVEVPADAAGLRVRVKVDSVRAHAALALLLQPHGLAAVPTADGRLRIQRRAHPPGPKRD